MTTHMSMISAVHEAIDRKDLENAKKPRAAQPARKRLSAPTPEKKMMTFTRNATTPRTVASLSFTLQTRPFFAHWNAHQG